MDLPDPTGFFTIPGLKPPHGQHWTWWVLWSVWAGFWLLIAGLAAYLVVLYLTG